MAKRVLVLGASGMLGSTLWRRLADFGHEVTGTVRGKSSSRLIGGVDALDLNSVRMALKEAKPEVVVNCVGLIRQQPNGQDPLSCISLNALFPHQLAAIAAETGTRVVHISTDCVFSGKKAEPYLESDISDAYDVYGRTKFLGELHGPNCITLRTSIIGHEKNTALSLVEWFLAQRGPVKGYRRAIYSGLPTIELCRVIGEFVLPNRDLTGLYHVSAEPISKFELLQKINSIYGCGLVVEPDDKVGDNKALNSSKFRDLTGWNPPSWDALVTAMHRDFSENLGREER